MKIDTCGYFLALILLALEPGCQTRPQTSGSPVPAELLQQSYIFEIARHLYRWHLDPEEVERIAASRRMHFWIHRLEPKLDPGDRSLLAEIILPEVDIKVRVKKADYTVEEFGTAVQSQTFKITEVTHAPAPARALPAWAVIEVDTKEMRDYLFRTRDQHDYPDPVLIERMRDAVRKEAALTGQLPTNAAPGELIVYLAPLSPVANETWVFWESGRKLLYFASDIDLANPAVWQNETLMARIFDLDNQVVFSHEEAPGSERFLTRQEVGRALFNCVVLGQRTAIAPKSASSK